MARVLVIGSVNADEVVHLDGPPTPGAHLTGRDAGLRLGGGGANAAVALALAGHDAIPWAAVGADAAGTMLVEACRAQGLNPAGPRVLPGQATNRPLILIDPTGDRTLIARRTLPATAAGPPPPDLVASVDALWVKTFDPALAEPMAAGTTRGPVLAHAPPHGITDWPATVWVTSETEASVLDAPAAGADPFPVARRLAGPALQWVVITRGPAGADAFGPEGVRLTVPAAPVDRVRDTTGAGDVFAAGVLHGLMAKGDIRAALRVGTLWAARTIAVEGSIPPSDLCDPQPDSAP